MAKKPNKKKNKNGKKNLSGFNIRELEDKLAAAKKKGNKKYAKRLRRKIAKKRKAKQANINAEIAQIKADFGYDLLAPEQQQVIDLAFDTYEADPKKSGELTPEVIKAIADKAAREINPEYDAIKDDITKPYEDTLDSRIKDVRTNISRAEEDLATALTNNDQVTAEEKRNAIELLKKDIATLESERNIFVDEKRKAMETKIADIQADLSSNLGRINKDELLQLRQLERAYTKELDNFQRSETSKGYAWSTQRAEGEKERADIAAESRSTTKESALRRREDAQLLAERGIRDINTIGEQEIGAMERQTANKIGEQIRANELKVGTEYILNKLGGTYGDEMIGEVTGALNRYSQEARDQAVKTFTRSIEDGIRAFTEEYGSKKAKKEFGNYKGFGGYGDFSIDKGVYGSRRREKKRQLRQNELDRKSAISTRRDILEQNRSTALTL